MRVQLDVAHPYLLRPGEGEIIFDQPQRTLRILTDREELTVTWFRYAPGESGPDPHVHRQHTDAFYVLDGELEFGLGPEVTRVGGGPGTLAAAPAGVVHTFRNASDRTAVFLNIHAPSMGFGDMLRARRDGRSEDAERFDQFEPPSDGGRPFEDAILRGPGEGDSIAAGTSTMLFKAEGGDGDGTFSLTEITLEPAFPGPLPHRHRTHLDSFFVLEGTLTLRIGDDELEAGPGSYGVVPPGNVHTFANRSEAPVRALNLMTPGGFEQYLKEAAAATPPGSPPDSALMAEIAARYDFEPESA
jgi:quercetin dioxygenase-like cupin family protein